jgi:hypothetical protein
MMQLDRIVRAAGASLGESLNYYWPNADEDCMALERNISLHFAYAFRSAGQLVFGEVNPSSDKHQRCDLLAIDTVNTCFTIAEFKRVYDASSEAGFVGDWQRLVDFKLQKPETHQHPHLPELDKYGLIAAITENRHLARWFNTFDRALSAPASKGTKLGPLDTAWEQDWKQKFDNKQLYIDTVPLADWHERGEEAQRTHWLVYVIAEL